MGGIDGCVLTQYAVYYGLVGVFKVKSVEKNLLTLPFHVSLASPGTVNLPLLYLTIPYFFFR